MYPYTDALQEIRDVCALIIGFGSLKACELAKSPGRTEIMKVELTGTGDGYWRIKNSKDINDILKGKNIIWFIKNQRLNWLGHVECMAEDNIVQKIKRLKSTSKRPIGRPKISWKDDVLEDIKSINTRNWKKVAQNRDSWKKVVEQAEPCIGCSAL